ncbi:hypothetical protein FLAV_00917 [Flavobacteriales bacterium]|nr:hypothetical protein FLAV_00917 [Flavobacteriales bacterium]
MKMQVLLYSMFMINYTIFSQSYNNPGGIINTCTGTFYDTGGSGTNYTNNQNITTTFCPTVPGQCISINFLTFNTQAYYDILYVYDGNSTSSPLLGMFSGNSLPGVITGSINNLSGCLTFKFVSNGFTNAQGWSANISCSICQNPPIYVMSNDSFTTCNGTFYDTGGPNLNYNWNEKSEITFCPSNPGECMGINFNPITLELDFDSLFIFDGPNSNSQLMAIINDNSPAQNYSATSNNPSGCLTIKFSSDGWDQRPGWSSTLQCVPCTEKPYIAISSGTVNLCDGNFFDNGGKASDYINNSNSVTTVCSDNINNPFISLSFSTFQTELNFDILSVFDGPTTGSPLIGNFSGNLVPFIVMSTNPSGCLTFRFISDGGVKYSGWESTITCTEFPLPVTWLEFYGVKNNTNISLFWSTSSEKNNDYFTIERLVDAESYKEIGKIKASGNSNTQKSYSFIDINPLDGWNYYRIKQTDYNGKHDYSEIVAIKFEKGFDFFVSQNNQNIYLSMSGIPFGNNIIIDLYDLTGKLLFNRKHSIFENNNKTIIPINRDLTTGVYLVKLTLNNSTLSKLIFIK